MPKKKPTSRATKSRPTTRSVKVDYTKDDTRARPAVVTAQLDGLSHSHTSVRQQLDILRKTRGTRDVGAVRVPAHLQAPMIVDGGRGPMSDADVEVRGTVAAVLGPKD